MESFLKIGLIQPVIDPELCWNHTDVFCESEKLLKKPIPYRLNIDLFSAERVWQEIKEGLRLVLNTDEKPQIILIPELHLPPNKISEIKNISKIHNVVIISGVDFQRNKIDASRIRNNGIITIPNNWGKEKRSSRTTTLYFGKTYFTYMERSMFENIEGAKCLEDPEQNMYVFESSDFGKFGIMICSDIFDIERMMLYQARIHHLFIISLNKDLNTYFSMSEALSRLLYCNVVVCNTGHYGGSLAISPYNNANQRIIYKYQGQKMFNTHVISVPILDLDKAQKTDYSKPASKIFKASPPGYFDKINY